MHPGLLSLISLTCCVDFKVGGFVGNVAHRLNPGAFGCNLGGVAERFVYIHLEWTFRNFLTCE